MIDVTLYADRNIKHNIKYRGGGLNNSTVIATVKAVSNGDLANKNIYLDNSIEISTPIDTCAKANYIGLKIGSTIIAGEITGLDYINDNNTSVNYAVDHYTTAQMTNSLRGGFFDGAFGLCKRTNLTYPKESIVNQQSEPYSGSDIHCLDTKLTQLFNAQLNSHTGITPKASSPLTCGYVLVLWLSAFAVDSIIRNGGSCSLWEQNPTPPQPNKTILVNNFGGNTEANAFWRQSYATGFPVKFSSETLLTDYINGILSNVGQKVIIPSDGIDGDGTIRRFAMVDSESQYFYSPQEYTDTQRANMKPVEMEQVKIITDNDILRIQIIPERYASKMTSESLTTTIDTGYGLNNFNPLKDERDTILPDGTVVQDFSKSKLMLFPNWYFEIVTRIGNKITIIPQVHMKETNYLNDYIIKMGIRFVGGVMPKLQIAIFNNTDYDSSLYSDDSETLWQTVFEYPSISWANNVSSQQQIGELQARLHRTGQMQSGIIGASVKATGFMYGFRGGQPTQGQGWFRRGMTQIGNKVAGRGFYGDEGDGKTYPDIKKSLQSDIDSKTAVDNAGRIVTNDPVQIIGEGSIEMLTSQPISVYRCGMTDGELYGFGRFIERKGQTCHLNINPITNGGDVFSGNASITSYGGKTYYEFFDLDVTGTMPVDFKNAIQMMFCGGCYLIG